MHTDSLIAPQHPKNEIRNIIAPRTMIAMGICVGLLLIRSKNDFRIKSQSCMYLVTYEASTNASDMSPIRTKAMDPAVMRAIPAN